MKQGKRFETNIILVEQLQKVRFVLCYILIEPFLVLESSQLQSSRAWKQAEGKLSCDNKLKECSSLSLATCKTWKVNWKQVHHCQAQGNLSCFSIVSCLSWLYPNWSRSGIYLTHSRLFNNAKYIDCTLGKMNYWQSIIIFSLLLGINWSGIFNRVRICLRMPFGTWRALWMIVTIPHWGLHLFFCILNVCNPIGNVLFHHPCGTC